PSTASLLASSPTAWAPMPSATRKKWPRARHCPASPAGRTAKLSWLWLRRMPTSVRLAYSMLSRPLTRHYPRRLVYRRCGYATGSPGACIEDGGVRIEDREWRVEGRSWKARFTRTLLPAFDPRSSSLDPRLDRRGRPDYITALSLSGACGRRTPGG